MSQKNLLKRLKSRKKLNRYDQFKLKFYDKVQKGFLKLAKKNNKFYQIINSNLDIEINKKIIINKIDQLIGKR